MSANKVWNSLPLYGLQWLSQGRPSKSPPGNCPWFQAQPLTHQSFSQISAVSEEHLHGIYVVFCLLHLLFTLSLSWSCFFSSFFCCHRSCNLNLTRNSLNLLKNWNSELQYAHCQQVLLWCNNYQYYVNTKTFPHFEFEIQRLGSLLLLLCFIL